MGTAERPARPTCPGVSSGPSRRRRPEWDRGPRTTADTHEAHRACSPPPLMVSARLRRSPARLAGAVAVEATATPIAPLAAYSPQQNRRQEDCREYENRHTRSIAQPRRSVIQHHAVPRGGHAAYMWDRSTPRPAGETQTPSHTRRGGSTGCRQVSPKSRAAPAPMRRMLAYGVPAGSAGWRYHVLWMMRHAPSIRSMDRSSLYHSPASCAPSLTSAVSP